MREQVPYRVRGREQFSKLWQILLRSGGMV